MSEQLSACAGGREDAFPGAPSLGPGLTVFVSIEVAGHDSRIIADFTEKVVAMPEVVEFYRLAGDADFGLRVTVADMSAYDSFYRSLVNSAPLKNVTSRIALENLKAKAAYRVAGSG